MDSKTEFEPVRRRRQRRKTLTDTMIAALPRRPGVTYFHPDPEMPKHGVRVRPAGPGTYTAIARDPYGKQKWVRIGSTAELSIAAAREKAREVIRRVEAGLEAFEPPKPQPDSVAAVAETWLIRHVEKNKLRTGAEMRRIVDKYILPHIGQLNFVDLRRQQIAELLDHIEDQHGASQADHVLGVLRAMATFVQARNESYVPPFVRNMRRVPKGERKRNRKLDDAELQSVWRHAEAAGDYGAFIQLLLLTAQRYEKVIDLQWDDISPDGVWTVRTEEGEKGNIGQARLPDVAMQIINARPRFVNNPFIFAGRRGRRVFSNIDKQDFDRACGAAGWRLHDLRRTAKSLMSRARVLREHSERVLGHAIPGVEGVYDHHEYFDEKSEALRRLAALIETIINPPAGDNVLSFTGAAS